MPDTQIEHAPETKIAGIGEGGCHRGLGTAPNRPIFASLLYIFLSNRAAAAYDEFCHRKQTQKAKDSPKNRGRLCNQIATVLVGHATRWHDV